MKVFCCLLVLFAVLQASQGRNANAKRFIERMNLRTTFNRRLRTNIDPLIVGGRPADIANFPHILALLDMTFGGFICGASNISPGWALSAGLYYNLFECNWIA
jgi:secreted trypsin-like serine protease